MAKDWTLVHDMILEEYFFKEKPLAEVMTMVEGKFGFIASARSYRTQLKKWGYTKYRTQACAKPKRIAGSGENSIPVHDAATPSNTQSSRSSPIPASLPDSPDDSPGEILPPLSPEESHNTTIKIWDLATGQCVLMCEGHNTAVDSVTLSPDSTLVAVGSGETVKLWDTATGQCRQTLQGQDCWPTSVAFSPNGSTLASISLDKTVKLWDTTTGQCLQTFGPGGGNHHIYSVTFSPDGTLIGSKSGLSGDPGIALWDSATGQCRQTLKGYCEDVLALAFSPDSTTLVVFVASQERVIDVWNTATGQWCQALKGHSSYVNALAFSPDGATLASASADQTVMLWDPATGQCRQTLKGHSQALYSVAFSPNGTVLASGSRDHTVKLWDPLNGQCLQTVEVGTSIADLSFDSTGSYLRTPLGSILLSSSPSSNTTSMQTLPWSFRQPCYTGYGLSPDYRWITRNSEKLLGLPPEENRSEAVCSVGASAIAHGFDSGLVLIFRFSAESSVPR